MARLPSKKEILDWISQHPTQTSKRDIAKAFGIKGADRIDLKRILKDLEAEGHLEKRRKTYRDPERLPPVAVLEVLEPDADGDLTARPLEWAGTGDSPRIHLALRRSDPALGPGDRILARLTLVEGEDKVYTGRLIRRIGHSPRRILGVLKIGAETGRILSIDKGADREWLVPARDLNGAEDGELVEAEQIGPKDRMGLPKARVVERLGNPSEPKAVSLIAIHQHGIPNRFPEAVLKAAEAATEATAEGREDLRDLPFVTIDPADARDHDDACWARPDDDPGNPDGHVIWVAIADVAHYVRPGSELDREARRRGNSTYFPDRVVPMLPDRLSGDLCSLHEGVDRPCIAVEMRVDADGALLSHRFARAMMRSRASLVYEEVEAARQGETTERTEPFVTEVIAPLYAAYEALTRARKARQPLDLDLPERQIILDQKGRVRSVAFKERLDAHRLIEEFMVLANVAAAVDLTARRTPLLFRVHEEPAPEKLDALREVAEASGLVLAKGRVLQTSHLNTLLAQAEGTDYDELINLTTLRSMAQAYYSPDNLGHFGLALKKYAHFTSPIRRYSDLVVHRALIRAHGWGEDGLSDGEMEDLEATGTHISETERRSMTAERDTTDRYLAAFLSERVGTEMTGRISGVARFGAFVKLDETGADGLVPIRELGREFFHFDRESQTLMGADTGMTIGIGQRVTVRLAEAVPITGGLRLDLIEIEDKAMPAPTPRKRGAKRGGAPKKKRVVRRRRK
ncbi:ribonuclease R [Ovoidimarina sediminis]|uniref:ribonuclease R n=1 Tax=Ovoidimarina sediminis TaxID=3079856 RepID=UPI00290D77F4|nr:ribonuclease R [Rhodophyticola sp. MJ-SS7]MDU8942555.1 ribonuclease R [Rhodophyticola sp. MJ-SS7]